MIIFYDKKIVRKGSITFISRKIGKSNNFRQWESINMYYIGHNGRPLEIFKTISASTVMHILIWQWNSLVWSNYDKLSLVAYRSCVQIAQWCLARKFRRHELLIILTLVNIERTFWGQICSSSPVFILVPVFVWGKVHSASSILLRLK
jgi:hypothetical protein